VEAESGNLAGSVDGNDAGAGVGATDGLTGASATEGTEADAMESSEAPTGTFARLRLAGLM